MYEEDNNEDMFAKKKASFLKPQTFKVMKAFTADKFYKVGSSITLSDKKLIERLIIEKYIK